MTRFLAVVGLVVGVASALGAAPRWFAPAVLRPGAVNEVYAWDEAPLPEFRVLVVDPEGKTLATARSFVVDRPLGVLGAGGRPLKWSAALVAPEALASGAAVVRFLDSKGDTLHEAATVVRARTFPSEDLVLDRAMTALRSQPNPQRDRESAALARVYEAWNPQAVWPGGRFVLPAPGAKTTAHFGDRRNYVYTDGTSSPGQHLGTDFGLAVGTPVQAPGPGRVVFSGPRVLTGETVVLEHAPGLFSTYFHLSQRKVKAGAKVDTGQVLGLAGATGLVTGPHLHWEVRVGLVAVDPLDLVAGGLLDTRLVSEVISSSESTIH